MAVVHVGAEGANAAFVREGRQAESEPERKERSTRVVSRNDWDPSECTRSRSYMGGSVSIDCVLHWGEERGHSPVVVLQGVLVVERCR